MDKYKVEVKELGMNKISKTTVVKKIDYDTLYKIVKPHLLSSDIWFTGVIENEWGHVNAGFHTVGEITFSKV